MFDGTPSQTAGPFLQIGMHWEQGAFIVPAETAEGVWLRGHIFDGAGVAIPDAAVEIWQADPAGCLGSKDRWLGFGRSETAEGEFAFYTVVPGSFDGQAPHLGVAVFARGLLRQVWTRIYFPEHRAAQARDPILALVPDERRATLIAERTSQGYRFDIRLQGPLETVFFDV
ncbi:protocatechuate 3,4-dioxygenase subunit alpha [Nocardia panacis]|uniref:Protocatechuate 3,4-dioxygenase subunit alpha n=1 Tax=Nocardia panacis TaxID=2340916 RepID=A0A3A4KZ41_9NOCA|nr:protocatechuate 3,4-dioxygenase subunit alpha [Nocardia panacis]RJO79224.1 protocatechuate 3,4-dioxygenase subunit alpha [Nocardia panacis]